NDFASAEAIEELGRGRGWGYAKFCAESSDAGLVLPNGQLHLSLSAVASHQSAMGVLSATVAGQKPQAYGDAAGIIAWIQTQGAKPVECIKIAKTQAFPGEHRPLFVGVVGKKLTLIEPSRCLESCLRLHEFCTRKVLMSGLELFLENLNINPDAELRI